MHPLRRFHKPECSLIHHVPHRKWHGVPVLPRAGWVLETRLHSWCPPHRSEKLQDVESNHGSQAYETRRDANPSCRNLGVPQEQGSHGTPVERVWHGTRSVPRRKDAAFRRLAPGQRIKNTHLCSPLGTATAGISRRFFGRFRRAWGLSVSERRSLTG